MGSGAKVATAAGWVFTGFENTRRCSDFTLLLHSIFQVWPFQDSSCAVYLLSILFAGEASHTDAFLSETAFLLRSLGKLSGQATCSIPGSRNERAVSSTLDSDLPFPC